MGITQPADELQAKYAVYRTEKLRVVQGAREGEWERERERINDKGQFKW